ncbi:MAG: hypothetical protein HY282_12830 [Nitrospirae bacterium]|nr:hypothetical protein [Candidatus Manganitrophaceae bacterium]
MIGLSALSPWKDVAPAKAVRRGLNAVALRKETRDQIDRAPGANVGRRPDSPTPRGLSPSVSVRLTRSISGETIQTFMNPMLSKTGEELYVMWLNNQVIIQGKSVDLYL